MRLLAVALVSIASLVSAGPAPAIEPTPEVLKDMLYLDVKGGRIAIKLRPDLAPNHVKRVKRLAREGFYDGLKFHRVIDGFMAQTGDPKGDGTGGSKYADLKAEFSSEPFKRGTVGAARTSMPHTANSQFFICFEAAPFLNGKYTVWGEVVRGMHLVDKLKRGEGRSGRVRNADTIVKMQVATDAKDHSVLTRPDPEPTRAKSKRGSF